MSEITTTERVVKLARSGMRSYAHKVLKEQEGLCPLCGTVIDMHVKGEGVLDHDHDSGKIRGVLHRSCNAAEGKIANAAARWGAKSSAYPDIIKYLKSVVQYLETVPRNVIYPMHKSAEEKDDIRKVKAKERRAELAAKRKLAQLKRKG